MQDPFLIFQSNSNTLQFNELLLFISFQQLNPLIHQVYFSLIQIIIIRVIHLHIQIVFNLYRKFDVRKVFNNYQVLILNHQSLKLLLTFKDVILRFLLIFQHFQVK